MTDSIRPKRVIFRRMSWMLSLLIHLFALGWVMNESMGPVVSFGDSSPRKLIVAQRFEDVDDEPVPRIATVDTESKGDPTLNGLDQRDQRWKSIVEQEGTNKPPASDRFIKNQVSSSIDRAKGLTNDEGIDRLNSLSDKLRNQGTEKGVGEVSQMLSGVLGTKARKTDSNPQAGEEIEFDLKTAQLDDVKKIVDEEGVTHYIAILIDANGERAATEMDEANGKQLFQTMKLIKSNPLLEQVYRKLVMGVLDKLLGIEE